MLSQFLNYFKITIILSLAGTELLFFVAAHMVLCFRMVIKTVF